MVSSNLLILGAGASFATHDVPITPGLLCHWRLRIIDRYPLLAMALGAWVTPMWAKENLERAWTLIDLAWKERNRERTTKFTRELCEEEVVEVFRLAVQAAAREVGGRTAVYYAGQFRQLSSGAWTPEQFLSVVAGFELRRLIQEEFVVRVRQKRCGPYMKLNEQLLPKTTISFNYDTLFEQYSESWGTGAYYYPEKTKRKKGRLVQVLKPHGSVNWTHRMTPTEHILFDETLSPDQMGSIRGSFQQNMVIGLRDKIEHSAKELSPVVRATFDFIMGRCEQAVAEAESIWIVGYGFPLADESFLKRLKRGVERRSSNTPLSLAVISYGAESKKEYLDRVGDIFQLPTKSRIRSCFCGFESWGEEGHDFH